MTSLGKRLLKSFARFSVHFGFFAIELYEFFYLLDIKFLPDFYFVGSLFYSMGCFFASKSLVIYLFIGFIIFLVWNLFKNYSFDFFEIII